MTLASARIRQTCCHSGQGGNPEIFKKSVLLISLWLISLCFPCIAHAGLVLEDAIELTLSHQPALELQQQIVLARRGQLKAAEGTFDTHLRSNISQTSNRHVRVSSGLALNVLQCDIGLTRTFESGLRVSPLLSAAMIREFGQAKIFNNTASIDFVYPLMRGREISAVQTRASHHLEAEELRLIHQRMLSARQTALAYWDALIKQQNLVIWQQSTKRIQQKQGKLFSAYQATYADFYLQAQTQWFQARQQLAMAMNLSLQQMTMLDQLESDFPMVKTQQSIHQMIDEAAHKRADYQAFEKDRQAFAESVVLAQDAMRPRMDVGVALRYEGFRGTNTTSVSGPNTSVNLSMDFPWQNRVANAQMAIAQSAEQQQAVQRDALLRQICTEIDVRAKEMALYTQRIQQTQASSAAYFNALHAETDDFRWMDMHDRYISARIRDVQARGDYAKSLVQLRFAAGELLVDGVLNLE